MSEWSQVTLRDIATDIKDGTHGTHARIETGVPFLSAKNVKASGKVAWDDEDEAISETEYRFITSSFSPKSGDLLVTVVGTLGRTAIFDGAKVAFQRSVAFVRPNKEVLPEYLFHASTALEFSRQLERRSNATAQAGLYLGELAKIRIPLPPPPYQHRIAEILSMMNEAIEKTEALIAKYQQIKAGLMHDLFTRGVTADGKLRPPREQAPELYQETPIGWIPKEWQYELLDKLAVRGSGHTPNKNFPEYWNGGIKWISLADSYRLDRLYITDTEYEISQLGIQNSSATVHPAGTVVISRDAGIGKSAITTESMAVSQHFMCWRCDARLDKHFLYYWLQFKKRMFENIAMGSTILTIGLPYFKKLKIAAPIDPEEQKQIGEGLLSIDRKIFSLEADLEKKRQQKSGLMHDLLTGRVRAPQKEAEVTL